MQDICVRKICLQRICAISFLTLALTTLASAQLPSGGNAFVGYSYVHGETFTNTHTAIQAPGGDANMNGWEASVEGKYLPWLGGVIALNWHYGGRDTICFVSRPCSAFRLSAARDMLLVGPRVSTQLGKYRPFAEVLFGVGYQSDKGGGISNSDLTFATAFGGGLDYSLVRSVALRAQLRLVHTSFFGGGQNDPQVSTGLVFRF